MDIIPIHNLPVLRLAAPAAAPSELVTTRAIEFRPQEQDATYTPGHGGEEQPEGDPQSDRESYEFSADSQPEIFPETFPESLPDEPHQGTISLFA